MITDQFFWELIYGDALQATRAGPVNGAASRGDEGSNAHSLGEAQHPGRWPWAATLWADADWGRDRCPSSVPMKPRRSLLTSQILLPRPVGNNIDAYGTGHWVCISFIVILSCVRFAVGAIHID